MKYYYISLLFLLFLNNNLSATYDEFTSLNSINAELPPSDTCFYLAYDGFDYSTNAALNGQTNGTGFAGPWLVQDNNIDIPGYQIDGNNTSLQYLDFTYRSKFSIRWFKLFSIWT